jgi:hypothetical protein
MRINQPPLFSGAVVSGFIGDSAVVSGSIASGSIGTNHLASGVVVGFLTSGVITSGMIGAGAVFNNNIASGGVLSGKLGNSSVLSGSIGSGQIGRNHVSSGVLVPTYISGTANQILGINAGATANEYKTLAAAGNISITNNPNLVTIGTTGDVPLGYYISAYSDATQSNTGLASGNLMTYNVVSEANGISVRSGSNIVFGYPGTYNIQFSAQLEKTDGGSDDIDIWLKLNGANFLDSNTQITLPGNNSKLVAAWNWVLSVSSGDYTEIAWYSADADLRLFAEALISGHIHPAIPSVILTAVQVMNTTASGSITSGNIGNAAVVSGSIASGSIGVNHLISGLITTLSLGSGQVTSGNIASGVVFRLLSGNITSGFIGNAAVVSGSIGSGQIFTLHIASGGLLSGAIGSGQIGQFHLASGVGGGGASLTSGSVTSGFIGNAAVVSGSVGSGQISYPHIAVASGFVAGQFLAISYSGTLYFGNVDGGTF